MLGMQPPERIDPAGDEHSSEQIDSTQSASLGGEQEAVSESVAIGHRARARVRYDSANEPLPVIQRRKKALRGLAVLVLVAAAWLGYRYLTLHG